jgi:hypothetical protein
VAPLRLGGLRGKKSTPSVGWEVPVSFLWSASRSGTERGKRHSARDVSEAGVWLRYDLIGKVEDVLYSANYCYWDNMMRLFGIIFCDFVQQ